MLLVVPPRKSQSRPVLSVKKMTLGEPCLGKSKTRTIRDSNGIARGTPTRLFTPAGSSLEKAGRQRGTFGADSAANMGRDAEFPFLVDPDQSHEPPRPSWNPADHFLARSLTKLENKHISQNCRASTFHIQAPYPR